MSKMVVVDGNSIMFRAYYATAYTGNLMQTSTGIYTNAIYTFIVMMNKLVEIEGMTNIFVAFDKGKKTKRHQEYDDYKGTRKKMPEELAMQIPFIKEYLDVLGIKRLELDDYEADDIVGTVAFKTKDVFDEVQIISGDKDLLQLSVDNITVSLTKKGLSELDDYTKDNFFEKMGFHPNQLIDYKGLIGDSSDNLPGIPGVGPKTALKLLAEYETLEKIVDNACNIKGKIAEAISQFKDQALRTKKLAKIFTDAEFDFILEETKYQKPSNKALKEFYEKFELNSFIKRLGEIETEKPTEEIIIKEYINSDNINELNKKLISLEVELNGINYHKSSLIGLTISDGKVAYYFEKDKIIKDVIDLLENDTTEVITIDSKKVIVSLLKENIKINNIVFDLVLGSYVVDPSLGNKEYHDMINHFIENDLDYHDNVYGKKDPYVLDMEKVIKHSIKKCCYNIKVMPIILNKLKEDETLDLFNKMELPLSLVLAEVEMNGFKVDVNRLNELGQIFNEKLNSLEQVIYQMAGHEFNISSPKQLGVIIFEEMMLAKGKKNKTGYSTSADVLEKLAKKHPFPKMILEYRKYAKLVSTYINGLNNELAEDDLIHTTFKQSLTLTGRLSSVEPNIQNIPIRTEEGRLIRSAFVPRKNDGMLVSADYSQIELRVLASVSNCQTMINEFNEGRDFHSSTAAKVYGISIDDVTPAMRRVAKAVNFGIVYGMSAFGLSEDLEISVQEANTFINKYFEAYPEIKEFLNTVVSSTEQNGYTKTIFNRRRYIPEISSTNYMVKELGKRTAMNAPIQGSAADIMKYAMIKVSEEFKKNNLQSKMVAQVHDELIIDCVKEEIEIVKEILRNVMSSAVTINVKLDVDVETGFTWNLK